jgi:excisionase family DNA binding protein
MPKSRHRTRKPLDTRERTARWPPRRSLQSVEPILTGEQIAQLLQVKPQTIYEFTRKRVSGRAPMSFLRAGNFLRFRFSEIEKWMRESGRAAA